MKRFKIEIQENQKFYIEVVSDTEEDAMAYAAELYASNAYDKPDEDDIEYEVRINGKLFI